MKLSRKRYKYFAKAQNVLGKYDIATPEETVEEIVKNHKSIARFGDGEFDMIYGIGMNYQKYDAGLAKRLEEVVLSNDKDILIGLPNVVNLDYCEQYTGFATEFWPKWINQYKFKLVKLLNRNKKYYSTQITRFYLDYKDKSHTAQYVDKLKQIWNNRDVVIIEGMQSRLGVGNDLFDNMKSIQRIICPSENAFEIYDKIYQEALKIDKDKLVMLALGPTATVLAYDLAKAGYQAVDIGHVDIEYEWFLRKATTKIKIENKYVTEVKDGRTNIQDVNDEKYQKEIISKIL